VLFGSSWILGYTVLSASCPQDGYDQSGFGDQNLYEGDCRSIFDCLMPLLAVPLGKGMGGGMSE
jgi:hypothetical protein